MRHALRFVLFISLISLLSISKSNADETVAFQVTVHGGKEDRANAPVRASIDVPEGVKPSSTVAIEFPGGQVKAGQLTPPGICIAAGATPAGSQCMELHFIVPEIKAGATLELHGTIKPTPTATDAFAGFHWKDVPHEHSLLSFNSRPVLDYMCPKLDESSPDKRSATFKPYHHLYDPDGQILVTKGPGGLYPHHRALFYGFNKVSYDGKTADVWHCTNECYQSHEKILDEEAGLVLGRHRVAIDWRGKDKQPFAHEQREMTVYNVPGGTLIDFASRLETAGSNVKLDGDPQHAGFHFRAPQEVADKTHSQTIYIRTDGTAKPGETINWEGKTKDLRTINQPWKGMSFVLGEQRFTTAMLDLPTNPKEARFSERDYGRFGSYFQYDLTKDHPLEVRYRVWLQKGQMTPEQIAPLSAEFVEPLEATAKLTGN